MRSVYMMLRLVDHVKERVFDALCNELTEQILTRDDLSLYVSASASSNSNSDWRVSHEALSPKDHSLGAQKFLFAAPRLRWIRNNDVVGHGVSDNVLCDLYTCVQCCLSSQLSRLMREVHNRLVSICGEALPPREHSLGA